METTENNATSSPSSTPDASLRRRSGRVVRAPRKFSHDAYPSQNGKSGPKRKRGPEVEDEDEENQAPHDEDEPHEQELSNDENNDEDDDVEDDDVDDGDGDDEPTPKPKKSKSSQNVRPKKPAMKRAKVNGDAPVVDPSALTSNAPAMKLPNRPKKTAKIVVARVQDDGLYGKISSYHWRTLVPKKRGGGVVESYANTKRRQLRSLVRATLPTMSLHTGSSATKLTMRRL